MIIVSLSIIIRNSSIILYPAICTKMSRKRLSSLRKDFDPHKRGKMSSNDNKEPSEPLLIPKTGEVEVSIQSDNLLEWEGDILIHFYTKGLFFSELTKKCGQDVKVSQTSMSRSIQICNCGLDKKLVNWIKLWEKKSTSDNYLVTEGGQLSVKHIIHIMSTLLSHKDPSQDMKIPDRMSLKEVFTKIEELEGKSVVCSLPPKGYSVANFWNDVKEAAVQSKTGEMKHLKSLTVMDLDESRLNTFRMFAKADVSLSNHLKAIPPSTSSSKDPTQDEDDPCCICMCDMGKDDKCKILEKCSHRFHEDCITEMFAKMQKKCPVCSTWYGIPKGNQPYGTMQVLTQKGSVPGFMCKRILIVNYSFPNGVQGDEHPRPGVAYSGTGRTGYFPDTPEGKRVVDLLKLAFEYGLVFTVGDSVTSGRKDTVVWNNIHHKTSLNGGPLNYGYPDPQYLNRVEQELASQGVTADMLHLT